MMRVAECEDESGFRGEVLSSSSRRSGRVSKKKSKYEEDEDETIAPAVVVAKSTSASKTKTSTKTNGVANGSSSSSSVSLASSSTSSSTTSTGSGRRTSTPATYSSSDDEDEDEDEEDSERPDRNRQEEPKLPPPVYEFYVSYVDKKRVQKSKELSSAILGLIRKEVNGDGIDLMDIDDDKLTIKQLLIKQSKLHKQQQAQAMKHEDLDDDNQLQELIRAEGEDIATVRKNDVFAEDINEEDEDIIKQRVALKQKQYREYERRETQRHIAKIKTVHPYLVNEEIMFALEEYNNDEDKVIIKLIDVYFLMEIRKKIALKAEAESVKKAVPAVIKHIRRYQRNLNSPQKTAARQSQLKNKAPKLRLDDALEKENFEGWSAARIRAWQLRDKNPNAYYYRFNPPGETQINGKWTKEEREMFFKRMKEIGVNGQWGIFSMVIPGRVGYQCSNFYRHLVKSGEVKDENYFIDDKGQAHYLFSKGIIKKTKRSRTDDDDGMEEEVEEEPAPVVKPVAVAEPEKTLAKTKSNKRRKQKKRDDEDDFGDDDEYMPSSATRKRIFEEQDIQAQKESKNPLPGVIDPITLEEIEEPAISPYGHVMGKKTWLQCLNNSEPKNICPLTKNPLKYRDLQVLTWDNIAEYRDKIKAVDEL